MKKIGLDLDSVLAEIMTPLNDYVNKKYNTNFLLKDYTDFGLWKVWKCEKEESMRRVFDFYMSSQFNDILPITGAVEAIKSLKNNFELIVITSRPHITEKGTNKWIKKYFLNNITKVIHTNQYSKKGEKQRLKSEVAKFYKISYLVEDHTTYALDCANKGIKTFLLDMPWNKKEIINKNIKRVFNWKEIVNIIDNHSFAD